MRILATVAAFAVISLVPVLGRAQEKPETVVEGLTNPCGVAIQPGTNDVFVADSGAGRIVRIEDGKAVDVIVGFPKGSYGKGPKYDIGPLGLLFLDKSTLVVGGGGLKDGDEMLRVYKVPEAGKEAIKADAMAQNFKLAPKDDIKGEGNFYALARTEKFVYVTCNGDDTKGWVGRAAIKDGKLENFERYLATKEATDLDAPVGITISPDDSSGTYIVVGQMGEINQAEDAKLTFYSEGKEKLLDLETGLNDITALAYSTKKRGDRKQLYALDFNWLKTAEGGLFRLVAKGDEDVEAKSIATLDKPTAMAFAADGTLYVTIIGTGDDKPGKLLKFKPGL